MPNIHQTLSGVAATLLMLVHPAHAEMVVIVHPSIVETVDEDAIVRTFLGQTRTLSNGTEVVPVNHKAGSAAREEFGLKVLKRTPAQLNTYWSRQIFTGGATPPRQLENDEAVIKFVANTPGAIGYVDSTWVKPGVRVFKPLTPSSASATQ